MTAVVPHSRRSFMSAASCAVISRMGSSFAAAPAKLLAQSNAVNVRKFGAGGDGSQNDTAAFAAALAASPVLFVPAGVYLVDRIVIPAGRTILTAGLGTIFRQQRGTPSETRLINVVGSNVHIGACSVEGNISTDLGEQHHGIFIEASLSTGDLANITIGNVRGVNIRGDVVCVLTRDGRTVTRLRIGHVHGDNILRNVVSICGGRGLSVARVSGSRVGYTHLDIEPDDYNGPVVGCTIGSVEGEFVQVAGQTSAAYVGQVHIGLLKLFAPAQTSIPRYSPGIGRADALTIRNVRSLDIGQLFVRGFGGQAIRQIWDRGALLDQNIHIKRAEISDCCKDSRSAKAYILGNGHATRLWIDDLTVDITQPGVDAVSNCKEARIRRVRGRLPDESRLVRESREQFDDLLTVAGAGAMIFAGSRLARFLST